MFDSCFSGFDFFLHIVEVHGHVHGGVIVVGVGCVEVIADLLLRVFEAGDAGDVIGVEVEIPAVVLFDGGDCADASGGEHGVSFLCCWFCFGRWL